MFPTFLQYTKVYPRRVVLIGFIIFALVAYLWIQICYINRGSESSIPQDQGGVQEGVAREQTFEEKMRVLESLKSSEEDAVPTEEKMKILEDLASDAPSDISTEEKMKILESLKN